MFQESTLPIMTTPSAPASDASRLFITGAATPPVPGGEHPCPANSFTPSMTAATVTEAKFNLSGDPKVEKTDFTTSKVWFNKAAFTKPAPGTFGVQPNSVRQPGFWDANLSISKNFAVTEKQRFEFRAEGFNFLNHPRFSNATTNPNSGSFGLITSKTGNRLMQLNLKYFF